MKATGGPTLSAEVKEALDVNSIIPLGENKQTNKQNKNKQKTKNKNKKQQKSGPDQE